MEKQMATQHTKKGKASSPADGMKKEYDKMRAKLKASVDAQVRSACVVKGNSNKEANRTMSSYTGSPDSEAIASRLSKFSYHPELKEEILAEMKRY